MDSNQKLEKEKVVKKEISKLRRLLKDIPKNRFSAAEGLIHEAAFMRATLGYPLLYVQPLFLYASIQTGTNMLP